MTNSKRNYDDSTTAGGVGNTPEYVQGEAVRLRSEASKKAAPLLERATTLAALADATDEYLSAPQVLRRARFEPAIGGDDTNRRLLAEQVDLLRRADYSREVDSMDGAELASEIEAAARDGAHAKLAILHRRIKHEGAAHIADASWSAAKSRMASALDSVTTDDHKLLPKVAEIRDAAAEIKAYSELITTGKEPTRLAMRRVMGNLKAGTTDLQTGAPFKLPAAATATMA
jgi:hypothetical protein